MPKTGYTLRAAVNETTGYSPNLLNFGRIVPVTGDYYGQVPDLNKMIENGNLKSYVQDLGNLSKIYNDVVMQLHKAHRKNKKTYMLRKQELEFFVGNRVWKKNKVLSDAAKNFAQKLAPVA